MEYELSLDIFRYGAVPLIFFKNNNKEFEVRSKQFFDNLSSKRKGNEI